AGLLLACALLAAAGCDPIVISFGKKKSGTLSPEERARQRKIRDYQRAMRRNPSDPAAPAALGALYHRAGDLAAAEKHYRTAARLSPGFYAARAGLARLYLDLDRPADALVEAEAAAAGNPGDAEFFAILASAYRRTDRPADAEKALERGLQLDPQSSALLLILARARGTEGKWSEAAGLCRRARAADPRNPHAAADLAVALMRDGDPAGGLRQAAAAVQLRGAGAPHWEVLGCARSAAGNPNGAEAAFREAIRLQPDRASARRRLASLLERRGQREKALVEYGELVSRLPRQREPLERLAGLAAALNSPEEELRARLQLARAFPGDAEAQRGAGRALERAGKLEMSVGFWERAKELEADDGEAYRALARLWARMGKAGRATLHYKALLQKDANDATALEGLGALCVEEGRFKEARVHYEKLIKAHPDRAGGRAMLGLVAAELGDNYAAAEHLRAALKIDEALAVAHRELADVLRKLGQRGDARRHAERAVKLRPEDPKAWTVLARLERAEGRSRQEAEAYARAAKAAGDGQPKLIWAAAGAAEDAGDDASARAFYARLAKLSSERAPATRQLARMAKKKGRSGEELYWLRAALSASSRKAPWRPRVVARVRELYGDRSAVDAALALYWADFELKPGDPVTIAGLGALEYVRGELGNSARSYERLLSASPRSREAAYALVTIYERLGKNRKSLGAALRLVAIDPKSSEARFACARAYRRMGDRRREELSLRAAVKLDAKDAVAHNALGVLLAETDRLAEGRGHLERAAELQPREAWPEHNLAVLTGRDLKDTEMAARHRRKAEELVKAGAAGPPRGKAGGYWVFVPEADL
ncbi:MAG: tetratricopeptide repeat protein, partial [Planctomycetota bacterium]